ncbi:hypothetical protein JXL83_08760 [candidate division WOR-3 bacterium]|nr:hypothetical protein [candidate division WOR-3 bacterium]
MIYEKITEKQDNFTIKIQNTDVSGVKTVKDTKTGMRVYENGKLGIAGAIGIRDDAELKKASVDALKTAVEYPFEPASDREETWDHSGEETTGEELLEKTHSLLVELKTKHPEFAFSNSILNSKNSTEMTNDAGLRLFFSDDIFQSVLFFKQKNSSNILDGYVGFVSRSFQEGEILRLADLVCTNFLKETSIKLPGKYPVVLLTSSLSEFSFFSEHLSGLKVGTKTSSVSSKIGERIFHENFSLYQTNNPAVTYSRFFDSEGTVNTDYEYPLVENGIFKQPFTDKRTSARFGFKNTGSANFIYDGAPVLSPPSFRAATTARKLEDIIGDQKAVFAYMQMGGDFSADGFYGSPVQLSYLIEKGKITGRLPLIQIKSNAFEMFGKSFLGVTEEKFSPHSPDQYIVMEMEVSEI